MSRPYHRCQTIREISTREHLLLKLSNELVKCTLEQLQDSCNHFAGHLIQQQFTCYAIIMGTGLRKSQSDSIWARLSNKLGKHQTYRKSGSQFWNWSRKLTLSPQSILYHQYKLVCLSILIIFCRRPWYSVRWTEIFVDWFDVICYTFSNKAANTILNQNNYFNCHAFNCWPEQCGYFGSGCKFFVEDPDIPSGERKFLLIDLMLFVIPFQIKQPTPS